MPVIGNNQLPYPNTSDAPNIPNDLQTLASAVDAAIGGGHRIYSSLAALQAVPLAQCFSGMRATVSGDSVGANNGEYVYSSGSWAATTRIQAGTVNTSTDPNGYASIPFPTPMTVPPTVVMLTLGPTLNATMVKYEDLNVGQTYADHFTAHVRNSTNGADMGNNPVVLQWLAIWMGVV